MRRQKRTEERNRPIYERNNTLFSTNAHLLLKQIKRKENRKGTLGRQEKRRIIDPKKKKWIEERKKVQQGLLLVVRVGGRGKRR